MLHEMRRSVQESADINVLRSVASANATSGGTPNTTDSLVAIILVATLIVLSIVMWIIWLWRRRRARRPSVHQSSPDDSSSFGAGKYVDVDAASFDTRRPEKLVLRVLAPDPETCWVPQIKTRGLDLYVPPTSENLASRFKPRTRTSSPWHHPMNHGGLNNSPLYQTLPPNALPENRSPPALYHSPSWKPNTAPQLNIEPVAVRLPNATHSPSFSPCDPPISPTESADRSNPGSPKDRVKKLPRLMTVASAFSPTVNDELEVKTGETVRLLKEYEDDWCLVQRVGRIDAPKGMIPRFCLLERQEIIPSHKTLVGVVPRPIGNQL